MNLTNYQKHKEYYTKYRKQHKEYYNTQSKIWRQNNPELSKEYYSEYRKQHIDTLREYDKIKSIVRNPKLLRFKNKQLTLFALRNGICQNCGKNKHLGDIKLTHMHHLEYFIIFPWFGVIELCASCHMKTHRNKQ